MMMAWVQSIRSSFSHDAKFLLVKADLLDLMTGSIARHFTDGAGGSIFQATFAPDGEHVIAIVNNQTVEIWPTVEQMLLYADALIQRNPPIFTDNPPIFTDWELRMFELGQPPVLTEYRLLDAQPLFPFATPLVYPTPRSRPDAIEVSGRVVNAF